eukprot:Mycagemm_TRINITY_DN9345_c0_g2::TRINITY_DN9345_c0_g2_i1::g.3227::m.3227 type:complete len:108 gc:universal TRINITY_DN9345_c0_g2_i1:396-73(-)
MREERGMDRSRGAAMYRVRTSHVCIVWRCAERGASMIRVWRREDGLRYRECLSARNRSRGRSRETSLALGHVVLDDKLTGDERIIMQLKVAVLSKDDMHREPASGCV